MAIPRQYAKIIKEIQKKYGAVIDLKASPAVMIEILRSYAHVFAGGKTNGGGGVSSVAIAGPDSSHVNNADILKAVLKLQKEIKSISEKLPAKR